MALLRTLYARLALGLFLLLLVVGAMFSFLSLYSVQQYTAAVNQTLNRDLASNLVSDRNLVTNNRLNREALEALFELYMTINPSIEIYLLDREGRILSYSADPEKIKRNSVSLEPIHALMADPDVFPLGGDDPRSHNRRKVFSVTPVPSAANPEGYLYVVLRGEEYDLAESMVHSDRLLQMGGGALFISLLIGLLAGLVFFRLLTRRLSELTQRVEAFEADGLPSEPGAVVETVPEAGDDIDYLSARFDQMAKRIAAQLEQLKDKDLQRRQLVARVSHDLRTPLASAQGYLEALTLKQASLSEAERGRFLDIALTETHRLGRLLDELFELAALDARERQPSMEPFVMAELLHDVVQKHQPRADQVGVVLRIEDASAARVVADIAMTERVLDNLICNAISHTEPGSDVVLNAREQAGGAVITVSDSGPGIPGGDFERLFEPFYQLSDASGSGHAGLGLAIAKRLMELQGGRLWGNNGVAGGAEFHLWLPLGN